VLEAGGQAEVSVEQRAGFSEEIEEVVHYAIAKS